MSPWLLLWLIPIAIAWGCTIFVLWFLVRRGKMTWRGYWRFLRYGEYVPPKTVSRQDD